MATSTIPAAVDALLALITAAVPSTTQVFDGPVTRNRNFDAVIVAGSDAPPHVDGDQDTAALGAGSREEKFSIELEVIAFRGQDDQKETRDAAFATLALIENALRSNKTLTSTVRFAQLTGGISLDQSLATQPSPDGGEQIVGRRSIVTAHVHCSARI